MKTMKSLDSAKACWWRKSWISGLYASALTILMCLAAAARADDTDIYLKPPVQGSPPIVMMMLAYRPNLGSTVCSKFINGDGGADCKTKVGDEVWPQLVSLVCDSAANLDATTFTPVCQYDSGTGLATGPAPRNNGVDTQTVFQAILMTLIADKELTGLRLGLMLSHNDASGNAGGRQVRSDGSMIMQGAIELQANDIAYNWVDGSNNGRDILIKKIKEISPPAGAVSHPFSPKENFFEYYRYLTAGNVFFGDNGYLDFGDSDQTNKDAPESKSPMNVPSTPPATVADTVAAAYNLDAFGKNINERNRVGYSNKPADETSSYWPTNMPVLIPRTHKIPNYQNTWDPEICDGGSSTSTNVSQTCLSCRSGEANCAPATYKDPFGGLECTKVFAITSYVANNSDTSADTEISKVIGKPLSSGDAGTQQWLGWLYSNDISAAYEGVQNVTTYLVADNNKFGEATAVASLTGTAGAVLSLDENPDVLLAKLRAVFKSILIKSASFTAPSIPVNAFDRSDINDVAYLAMFQASDQPLWQGNIKKYKINTAGIIEDYSVPPHPVYERFTDASGKVVTQIRADALSGWTNAAALPNPVNQAGATTITDGRAVMLGGAGQMIPGNTVTPPTGALIAPSTMLGINLGRDNGSMGLSRMIYTDNGSSLIPLNATNANATLGAYLGAAPTLASGATLAKYREELVGFMRGNSVKVDGIVDTAVDLWSKPRTWMMGDVLHSRPVAVDYSQVSSSIKSRVYFGSNDGMLHQVRDEQSDPQNTAGREVWAYMPQEVLVNAPDWAKDSTLPSHPYGVDGTPALRIVDDLSCVTCALGVLDNSGDKAFITFGLRRGGKAYYMLDVTNPDAAPTLKWKITNATSGFSKLGMTFARPLTQRVKTGSSGATVATFLSGGYNGGYIDATSTPQTRIGKDEYGAVGKDEAVGNTLYIVDAKTGALIWDASAHVSGAAMVDSIAAEPALLDLNSNGIVDRIYVGDTGGRVWRMDLPEGDIGSWTTHLMADLGRHAGSGFANDRRFFNAPSVSLVQSATSSNKYLAITLTSGDREHPTQGTDASMRTVNSFFMLKDFQLGSTAPTIITRAGSVDLSANTYSGASVIPGDNSWYVDLTAGVGELGTSRPVILLGTVYFTTYTPTSSSKCSLAEGRSFGYAVNFSSGAVSQNGLNNDGKAFAEVGEGMAGDVTLFTQQVPAVDDPNTPEDESQNNSTVVRIIINGRTIDIAKDAVQELYWRDVGLDPKN